MIELLILLALLGLLWVALTQRGRWRERAEAAEKQNDSTQKANTIKNRVTRDIDERQRVRKHFDAS